MTDQESLREWASKEAEKLLNDMGQFLTNVQDIVQSMEKAGWNFTGGLIQGKQKLGRLVARFSKLRNGKRGGRGPR